VIYTTPGGQAQTRTSGPDGSLYLGSAAGLFTRLIPPPLTTPPGGSATVVYTLTASGSTQNSDSYSGTTSVAPFAFCGAAALDSTKPKCSLQAGGCALISCR